MFMEANTSVETNELDNNPFMATAEFLNEATSTNLNNISNIDELLESKTLLPTVSVTDNNVATGSRGVSISEAVNSEQLNASTKSGSNYLQTILKAKKGSQSGIALILAKESFEVKKKDATAYTPRVAVRVKTGNSTGSAPDVIVEIKIENATKSVLDEASEAEDRNTTGMIQDWARKVETENTTELLPRLTEGVGIVDERQSSSKGVEVGNVIDALPQKAAESNSGNTTEPISEEEPEVEDITATASVSDEILETQVNNETETILQKAMEVKNESTMGLVSEGPGSEQPIPMITAQLSSVSQLPAVIEHAPTLEGATYVKTDGIPKSCRLHADCYELREPKSWCDLKADENWTDEGCFCHRTLGSCIVKIRKNDQLYYTDCLPRNLWKCEFGVNTEDSK
ncbi:unnamed protein product [Thelazia callipaeda]|uniref:Chitin-binding type-2 domain-containing protein n=1 Tax=Thelazia callipaeda TaxID=103827 RepID=A0A0N5CMX8_THECL|nr:unnamed protein product [Thelazia callipaeda]